MQRRVVFSRCFETSIPVSIKRVLGDIDYFKLILFLTKLTLNAFFDDFSEFF